MTRSCFIFAILALQHVHDCLASGKQQVFRILVSNGLSRNPSVSIVEVKDRTEKRHLMKQLNDVYEVYGLLDLDRSRLPAVDPEIAALTLPEFFGSPTIDGIYDADKKLYIREDDWYDINRKPCAGGERPFYVLTRPVDDDRVTINELHQSPTCGEGTNNEFLGMF